MTTPPPLSPTRARSLFVTLLAWIMMLVGVVGLPISAITAMMVLVHSYGTANAGFLDTCTVVLGPLFIITTAVGLLRRWRLAHGVTIALMLVIFVAQAWQLVQGPRPATISTSASGVITTTMGSDTNVTSLLTMLVCAGLSLKLASRDVRQEFKVLPPSPMPLPGMTIL